MISTAERNQHNLRDKKVSQDTIQTETRLIMNSVLNNVFNKREGKMWFHFATNYTFK